MDGTQDSLSVVGQPFEEVQNVPRGLRIETGRGLVKEKKQLRFGNEFDSDGESLSLFDVKTCGEAG